MKKPVVITVVTVLAVLIITAYFLFFVNFAPATPITWGVNFSQMQAQALHLDWKKTYLELLNDLGVKNIKLLVQWDYMESTQGKFYFTDVDWQIQQAKLHDAKILYVVGLKTGHWPECHAPSWLSGLAIKDQQDALLQYISTTILKYKDNSTISAWQVENEPLFKFGQCPGWYYDGGEFLQKEIALVKSLDPSRQVIVSDSGEQSSWFQAASLGDVVSTTLYRKVWVSITPKLGFYGTMWFPPNFYWIKSQIISWLFHKKVINGELQAEPWAQKFFYDTPLAEQQKTMTAAQFAKNVDFVKKTGFDTVYFWGAEYWVWLKDVQGDPGIWNEAASVFFQTY